MFIEVTLCLGMYSLRLQSVRMHARAREVAAAARGRWNGRRKWIIDCRSDKRIPGNDEIFT